MSDAWRHTAQKQQGAHTVPHPYIRLSPRKFSTGYSHRRRSQPFGSRPMPASKKQNGSRPDIKTRMLTQKYRACLIDRKNRLAFRTAETPRLCRLEPF